MMGRLAHVFCSAAHLTESQDPADAKSDYETIEAIQKFPRKNKINRFCTDNSKEFARAAKTLALLRDTSTDNTPRPTASLSRLSGESVVAPRPCYTDLVFLGSGGRKRWRGTATCAASLIP